MTNALLDCKVAVVTGAAGGLGLAMAGALAAAGAHVIAADIDGDRLSANISEIGGAEGDQLTTVAVDLTQEEARERLINLTAEKHGRIDVLINNAGIGQDSIRKDYATNPLMPWDVPPENLMEFLTIHSVAPIRLASLAVPIMKSQQNGRLITVTTSISQMQRETFTAYGGAKAASEAYFSGLAKALAGTSITVNGLDPGNMADTRMVPDRPGLDRSKLVQPVEMGPPAVWLASDDADGVTGRHFEACKWDPTRPGADQVESASRILGWPD